MKKNYYFTPDWFAGFTESDGSFIISFETPSKGKLPLRPRPIFILTQSIRELDMFKSLQEYLTIGKIQSNRKNVTLVIKSIEEMINVLLPIFDKSPLRGDKAKKYQIFKIIVLMMANKDHLTIEGTLKILELSYFMNKETSLRSQPSKDKLISILHNHLIKLSNDKNISLPTISPIPSPEIDKLLPITLEFIRGQIDGDGSFNVSFRSKERRIGVNFTVVHELASINLLNELVDFFKCGKVYSLPSAAARYQVQTVNEILNNIYPKFKDIKFNTVKQEQFNTLIAVCEYIKYNGYKEDKDIKHLVNLAWNMNQDGKARKLTKEQYLELLKKI